MSGLELKKELINDIEHLISSAKAKAIKAVDFQRVLLYWQIGKRIFDEIQNQQDRADYGKSLIKNLANSLEPIYGSGYSYRQLYFFVQFYKAFPIVNTLYSQLSWSHYKLLIRIEDSDKREFYQEECKKNLWSVREFERQINSQLFERLLLSSDKKSVLEVAKKQKLPQNPQEIIKDPMVLEFLGLKMSNTLDTNLLNELKSIIQLAKTNVVTVVNTTMVQTYWQIGKMLVEDKQQGKKRAKYGKQQLQHISNELTKEFSKGFDVSNLRNMRRFYIAFPIRETVSPKLSWTSGEDDE